MNKIDITGQQFGDYTVLERDTERGLSHWKCKCKCGVITSVCSANLKRGTCRNCVECGFKKRRADITGQRFGKWTVVCVSDKKSASKEILYTCVCDCGFQSAVNGNALRHGKTLGCRKCNHGDKRIYKIPDARRYLQYEKSAEARNIEFSLNTEEFSNLVNSDCHYCGAKPSPDQYGKLYNGIDRVDNSKGYVRENVVPCCKTCNRMKHVMSYDDFLGAVKRISARLGLDLDDIKE